MAWIKMRSELQSHPKIVRILSATTSDKFRVVGGLHAVWSVFDQHSTDGTLFGYTPETMDHVIGWIGFSEALLSVGWLSFDGIQTLTLPEFDEHNSKGAKRRAEDQKRKRNDRNDPLNAPQESGQIADKKRTREEKEKKEQGARFALPDWIPADAWDGYVAMRKQIKKPMTDRACELKVVELEKMRKAGFDLSAILNKSTANSWTDIYAPKIEGGTASPSVQLPINQRPFI